MLRIFIKLIKNITFWNLFLRKISNLIVILSSRIYRTYQHFEKFELNLNSNIKNLMDFCEIN